MKDLTRSLFIAVLFTSAAWADGPTVELGADRVTASGLGPGGSAVFFGVAREPLTWSERVVCRSELVTDADGDGRVELVLDTELAWKSIWAVVDVETGEVSLAAPEDYPLEEMDPKDAEALLAGPSELARLPDSVLDTLQLLIVRPGAGAWSYVLSKGRVVAGEDLGRRASLDWGSGGRAPARQAGDVVVAIDPQQMRYFVAGPVD